MAPNGRDRVSFDRRQFLTASSIVVAAACGLVPKAGYSASDLPNLRAAARARGIEIGAFANIRQLLTPAFADVLAANFTLAAILFTEMEWGSNPGIDSEPSFGGLRRYLDTCAELGLRTRARQIYSKENQPPNVEIRADGTPKNKSELEKTLLARAEQVCKPLRGRNAIIQVIDEILADHEGGLRKNPFSDALGEEYVDLLFHAAHEAAPDALLIYQEYGPEIDPDRYFKRKTRDYLALLERLRKRNVPITGAALGGFAFPPAGQPVLRKPFFKAVQDLDYDIHLTELTVIYEICGNSKKWFPKSNKENDAATEKIYVRAFEFLCQFKRLREITFFAPVDGDNTVQTGTLCIRPYDKARPGIFNADLTPKPVYNAVARTVMNARAN